jgi:hypothetical protein
MRCLYWRINTDVGPQEELCERGALHAGAFIILKVFNNRNCICAMKDIELQCEIGWKVVWLFWCVWLGCPSERQRDYQRTVWLRWTTSSHQVGEPNKKYSATKQLLKSWRDYLGFFMWILFVNKVLIVAYRFLVVPVNIMIFKDFQRTMVYETNFLRSNDETMKLWDIRSFKRYVNMADGLFSRFDQTDCSFSPDNRMVITGSFPPTSYQYIPVCWFGS